MENLVSWLPGEESLQEGVVKLDKDLLDTVGLINEVVILGLLRTGARLQMVIKGVEGEEWECNNSETRFGCRGVKRV